LFLSILAIRGRVHGVSGREEIAALVAFSEPGIL
jgi:hypothetical protein